ncbi:MAG: SDR family NAD(P)-dependent oxidoreductase [Betaproteobacteria bacterium]|nr:SDR family NAD(P)-dependent oxidoreductase [Betaproteobacteria bacterium]MBK9605532.1 SDR family NAD(P)-dependent oxidoreductase [Betaproteobacteria bacterium]
MTDLPSASTPDQTQTHAGCVILVTGATGGLGEALSRALARGGATVALHGRVVRKLEALYDAIVEAGAPEPAILPLDFDKADSQAYADAAAGIEKQLGRLDAIVHCAGTLRRLAPIEHHTLEDWMTTLRVNLAAPAALTRALLPLLRRAPAARVIFTLDTRGHDPKAYWGSYAAAKAGLEALVHVLADEWENSPNLAVTGVVPGAIASPMRRRTHPGDDPTRLRTIDSLLPLYQALLGPDGERYRGRIIDAQAWLPPGA